MEQELLHSTGDAAAKSDSVAMLSCHQ
jgi:hypothetical protein